MNIFKCMGNFFKKSVDTVEEVAATTVSAAVTVGCVAGKAVESTGNIIYQGLEMVTSSLINSTKFLADSKYRNEVGYPWLKGIIRDNWNKVKQELDESQEMLMVLWKYSKGHELTKDEKGSAKEQLGDIVKTVPALGIFLLPGGMILLPLLAKALPWDLMPSSFKEKVKNEYGEDALSQELSEDEKIPVDQDATFSQEVQEEVEENMRIIVENCEKENINTDDQKEKEKENINTNDQKEKEL